MEEVEVKEKKRSRKIIKEIVFIAIFVDLLAICSWISIPTVVPFTLQTMGVMLCLGLLGGRRGTISISIYIFVGLIGVPVFASFKSGLGALLGPTGGYIIGFLVMGLAYWLFTAIFHNKFFSKVLGIFIGLILMYIFGTIWFIYVYNINVGEMTVLKALESCVIPFMIPEIIKLAISTIIINRVGKFIKFD